MRYLYIILFAFTLCINTLQANSLVKLEQIVEKVKDLDAFLADKELQDEYFIELQRYYKMESNKANGFREYYDSILIQLKEQSRKIPGFSKKTWAKQNIENISFEIKPSQISSGFELNKKKWESKFLKEIELEISRTLNNEISLDTLPLNLSSYKDELKSWLKN